MRYEAPETLDAAIVLLSGAAGTARVLAGGTDLLVQMKSGGQEPDLLVDIKRIPALREIREEGGGFRIGAAVPSIALAEHKALVAAWPGVVEAARLIGSTQVQGRCTIVGNLCNASPAADSVPAMIAANATVRVAGPQGTRDLPVDEIALAPGKTSLAKGEIVTSVFLPGRPVQAGDAYLRFIPRSEMDIAVVSCGVSLALEGGRIAAARVALGAVAIRALLVEEAAEAILGSTLDEAALDRLAAAASAAAKPIDDKRGTKAFRIQVAGVLARRAALAALQRAQAK